MDTGISPYCTCCRSLVRELVPWAQQCMGCYVSEHPNEEFMQLSLAVAKECEGVLPICKASRTVRLQDLAHIYFADNMNMARGYREASTQTDRGPTLYACIMGPFYALLVNK
jgi:hypothetical protein